MTTENKATSLDKYIKMAVSLKVKEQTKFLEAKIADKYKNFFELTEKILNKCDAYECQKFLKDMKKRDDVFFEVLCKTPLYKNAIKKIEAKKKIIAQQLFEEAKKQHSQENVASKNKVKK